MRLCRFRTCCYLSCCFILICFILASTSFYENSAESVDVTLNSRLEKRNSANEILGPGQTGLFWFAQVTDIQLSVFRDSRRGPDFEIFCNWLMRVVKPPVVVASGDLTDAKTQDFVGSTQYIEEWQFYQVR